MNQGAIVDERRFQSDDRLRMNRFYLLFCFALLCLSIAITNTYYVGDLTIYQEANSATRLNCHYAILNNAMPEGGWFANRMNGVNVRISTIYLVEAVHNLTGSSVLSVYRSLDLVFISATLFLSFFFFRSIVTPGVAFTGVMYFAWLLPLTYAYHNYHPWDRIGWFFWLLAIWSVRLNRPYVLGFIIALGITIKFDILAVAGLYFLVWLNLKNWKRVTVTTSAISLVGIAVLVLLNYFRPGGFDAEGGLGIAYRIKRIYWQFSAHPIDYPGALAFVTVFLLAPLGLASRNRFAIASFCYGAFLLCYISFRANPLEFRAQMGFLLMMMPLTLIALDRILKSELLRCPSGQACDPGMPQNTA
jgi:hypothetical protein